MSLQQPYKKPFINKHNKKIRWKFALLWFIHRYTAGTIKNKRALRCKITVSKYCRMKGKNDNVVLIEIKVKKNHKIRK